MNMLSFMPLAEKPADAIHTSGKSDAAKSDDSVVEDNGIFSELLLMLSTSGNNKAMPQNDGSMFLSSRLNQSGELQETPLLKLGSDPLVRLAQYQNEGIGERETPLLKLESAPLVRRAQYQNEGIGEQETPLLKLESDPLVRHVQSQNEDIGDQKAQSLKVESGHLAGQGLYRNKDSGEESVITDMTEDYLYSPGSDISLPATGDTNAYKESFNMNSSGNDSNRHKEQVPDMTADVIPEIIPDLVSEVANGNSTELASPHVHPSRPDIMSQLSDRLIDMYHFGGQSAKIRLQPEELGHLHIDISVVNDSIKAIVTVQDNIAKGIIDADLDMLIEKLRGAGLNVDQFTVNIESSHYDENIAGGWSDRNGREMLNDNIFTPQPVHEDTVLSGSAENLLYAGAAGGISIFV